MLVIVTQIVRFCCLVWRMLYHYTDCRNAKFTVLLITITYDACCTVPVMTSFHKLFSSQWSYSFHLEKFVTVSDLNGIKIISDDNRLFLTWVAGNSCMKIEEGRWRQTWQSELLTTMMLGDGVGGEYCTREWNCVLWSGKHIKGYIMLSNSQLNHSILSHLCTL